MRRHDILCALLYIYVVILVGIVHCQDEKIQANDNTFLIDYDEMIIFPENGNSIAERKCEEYKKYVSMRVSALPLLPNAEPVTIYANKCDYDSVPLIVGGEEARLAEFPHMVAIGFNSDDGIKYACGGTLISDNYVLTAAHCTYSQIGEPVQVRLGALYLNSANDGARPEDVSIAEIIRHPDLKPRQKYNDIALIRLSRRVTFSKFIRPACLQTWHQANYTKAVATGWGLTSQGGDPSNVLMKVSLDLVDNKKCNQYYRNELAVPDGIRKTMLCAGDSAGSKDTCQGDSGGPLVITHKLNQCLFYVIGITSFGKSCAIADSPAVYTRVSEYVPWIESVVWS